MAYTMRESVKQCERDSCWCSALVYVSNGCAALSSAGVHAVPFSTAAATSPKCPHSTPSLCTLPISVPVCSPPASAAGTAHTPQLLQDPLRGLGEGTAAQ
jgi:hypothetical protein